MIGRPEVIEPILNNGLREIRRGNQIQPAAWYARACWGTGEFERSLPSSTKSSLPSN
jgi:hypothetical protein